MTGKSAVLSTLPFVLTVNLRTMLSILILSYYASALKHILFILESIEILHARNNFSCVIYSNLKKNHATASAVEPCLKKADLHCIIYKCLRNKCRLFPCLSANELALANTNVHTQAIVLFCDCAPTCFIHRYEWLCAKINVDFSLAGRCFAIDLA